MANSPPFDLPRAQRWFAVELNNLAWDLVEATGPLPEADVDRMIHAAHASCHFWLASGNALNHLRAQNLLATAYAKAGRGEPAVYHAQKCLELSRSAPADQTDFDRATALGCAAAAYRAAGNAALASQYHEQALAAAGKLTELEDKSVFDRLYDRT
jgi:tetratricopeptide (TPR) repeat protein